MRPIAVSLLLVLPFVLFVAAPALASDTDGDGIIDALDSDSDGDDDGFSDFE